MKALTCLGAAGMTAALSGMATASLVVENFTDGFSPSFNHFVHAADPTQVGNWMVTDLGGEDCLALFSHSVDEITYCLDPGQTAVWASVRVIDYCGLCSEVEFIGTFGSYTHTSTLSGQWETFTTDGLGLGDILMIRLTSAEGAFDDVTIDVEGPGGIPADVDGLIVEDFTVGFDSPLNHFLHAVGDPTLPGNWDVGDLSGEDCLWLFQATDEVTYCVEPGEAAVWASVRMIDYCGLCTQVEFIGLLGSHTFTSTVVGQWETFTTDDLGLGDILRIRLTSSEGAFDDVSVDIEGPCPQDLDGSGEVAFGDLLQVLSMWGFADPHADFDRNGVVDFGDLLILLSLWGPCA